MSWVASGGGSPDRSSGRPRCLARESWPWSWVALGGRSPDRSSGRPRSSAYPRPGGPTPSPGIPQAPCRCSSAYPRRGGPTPSPGIPHASCRALQLGSVGHGRGSPQVAGHQTAPRADLAVQLGRVGPGRGSPWVAGHRTAPRADLVPRPTLVTVGQLPRPASRKLHADLPRPTLVPVGQLPHPAFRKPHAAPSSSGELVDVLGR